MSKDTTPTKQKSILKLVIIGGAVVLSSVILLVVFTGYMAWQTHKRLKADEALQPVNTEERSKLLAKDLAEMQDKYYEAKAKNAENEQFKLNVQTQSNQNIVKIQEDMPTVNDARATEISNSPANSGDTPTKLLDSLKPIYPNAALRNSRLCSQDNVVHLKVFVDEEGKALKVFVQNGVDGPYGFDDSAKDAALQARYAPAIKNGKPAKDWVTVYVKFPARK